MRRARAGFFPPIALDAEGPPLHRQLYDWFRSAILDGRLHPGQPAPSTRGLAKELKISRAPVLAAYDQLQAEGYLETFVGAGARIAASIPDDRFAAAEGEPHAAADRGAARAISRRVEALMAMAQDPPPSSIGAFRVTVPALNQFPHRIWAALLRRHARNTAPDLMAYGDPMGHMPFRESIAAYLGAARAVRCDSSQIMITAGSQQALQICARALLDVGDPVWMEEPGYPGAHRALAISGAELVPVPVDHEGLDVEEGVRRRPSARAAYITPSHQYPMGATMSATRRMQLLNWAARAGSWIIEDDYDSEYRFGGRPIAALQGLDADARVIYVGTFSKVLFPALRLGYLVIPKDLVPAFSAVRDAADIFPPTLFQAALTDFLAEGHFTRHLGRMRMLYKARCGVLAQAIGEQFGPRVEIVNAEAGMHLVALLPPDVDDRAISQQAAAMGLSVIPLSTCCLELPPKRGLILGYGGADEEQIIAGARGLGEIVRQVAQV